MKNAVLILSALSVVSCSDRTRELPPVTFEPTPEDDVGTPQDTQPPPTPDGICDAQFDGASCELPNARGVCHRQQCALVACETGFGDCEPSPGCETPLTDSTNCGGCGLACSSDQTCVQGPAGFVCAQGIVCPVDTFDLDSDPGNGCEWQATWEPPFTLSPPDLEIEAAAWGEPPIVAGGRDGARISVVLATTPQPTVWPEPRGAARAVDVRIDEAFERVVWTDGVSLRSLDDQSVWFLQPDCEAAAVPRRFVGATADFVATQFEVFAIDVFCPGGPCLQPIFGLADYHAAVFGDFEPAEVATCDGCAIALPAGCWGAAQCRDPSFDPMVCTGCDPAGCPGLDIVDLVPVGDLLGVVTARGALIVDPVSGVLDRVETAFDPGVAGGPRFVSGLDAPGTLTLFHSTGYARTLDSDLTATYPDVGVPYDPEVAGLAGRDEIFAAVVGDAVRLTRPTQSSGRTVFLDLATAPGIQGLRPVTAVKSDDGIRVAYQAAGQLFMRRVDRTVAADD